MSNCAQKWGADWFSEFIVLIEFLRVPLTGKLVIFHAWWPIIGITIRHHNYVLSNIQSYPISIPQIVVWIVIELSPQYDDMVSHTKLGGNLFSLWNFPTETELSANLLWYRFKMIKYDVHRILLTYNDTPLRVRCEQVTILHREEVLGWGPFHYHGLTSKPQILCLEIYPLHRPGTAE